MTDPSRTPQPTPRVRDRDVVLAAALVVAGVLIVAWLTGLVPALDNIIGLAPVVIIGMVVVTALVLFSVLRRR
jgi:hypothetical protein